MRVTAQLIAILVALPLAGLAAEQIRFVWESPTYGKPGYLYGRRIEETVTPGKGTCYLTQGGTPRATIVLAADPTRSAQVAARELQHYVAKITGARLRVTTDQAPPFKGYRVLIGESALTRTLGLRNADFEPQEHLIRSYGHMLVLMGCDEEEYGLVDYEGTGLWPDFTVSFRAERRPQYARRIGSVYAVDEFLRRFCEVRWFMPGELGEFCLPQDGIRATNLDLCLRPWSEYRWFTPQNFRDFAFIGSGRPDVTYARKHGWRDINLWLMRMKVLGCEPFHASHSLIGEWFQRRFPDDSGIMAKGRGDNPRQLCYSSRKLMDVLLQDIRDYWAGRANHARTGGPFYPIMPHDVRKRWCTCTDCRARLRSLEETSGFGDYWTNGASNYVWGLVNEVARRAKTELPGLNVSCAAYQEYTLPPDFPLHDNVAVIYCRILADYVRRPGYREFSQKWLREWARRTRQLYTYGYLCLLQLGRERFFPAVFPREMAADVRFLRSIGVKGMFFELNSMRSVIPNIAQDHLNLYVLLRLLAQDVQENLTADQLVGDHCTRFYGPAAAPMKQFYGMLEERFRLWRHVEGLPVFDCRDLNSWAILCPPPVLRQFAGLLSQAKQLASDKPYVDRLRLIEEGLYGMMARNCERFNYGYAKTETPRDATPAAFEILGENDGFVTEPGQFDIDAQGNVYVPDWRGEEVLKFGPKGETLLRIPVPGGARCVCVDGQGDLYVAGYRGLTKFRSDGAKAWDFEDGLACRLAKTKAVVSVAVDRDGDIWVIADDALLRFSRSGSPRALPRQAALRKPVHVKAWQGKVAVLDHGARAVFLCDVANGTADQMAIDHNGPLASGFGLDESGNLYVGVANGVAVLSKAGKVFSRLPCHYPRDVELDSDGNLYLSDMTRVLRLRRASDAGGEWVSDFTFGAGAHEPGSFAVPFDLCTDAKGCLYVCDLADTKVQKFSPDGALVWASLTSKRYNGSIAVDGQGRVYVGNGSYNVITCIGPDGVLRRERKCEQLKGTLRSVAATPDGHLLITEYNADGKGSTRLWKLTPDLEPVREFGSDGSLYLELNGKRCATPEKLTLDRAGNIYWIEPWRGIVKLTPNGAPARDFLGRTTSLLNLRSPSQCVWEQHYRIGRIRDVALTEEGDVLVLDSSTDRVVWLDTEGNPRGSFGTTGYARGRLRNSTALCVAPGGVLYVADGGNSRVCRVAIESLR